MAKVDLTHLRKLEADRLINVQQHPERPLLIFNYTPGCAFSGAWDEHTTMCRGLITDLEGNVVARPFPKFFNLAEHMNPKLPRINWAQGFTALEKWDGSLAILVPGENPSIATRGSFTSPQAQVGTRMLHEKGYAKYAFDPGWTYLWELIYPENRIVVDYRGMRELVLLDVIHTDGRHSMPYSDLAEVAKAIGCPVVEHIPFEQVEAEAELMKYASQNSPNREGLVVRFDDGLRVKIKLDDYCRLHKLLTGVSPRRIWESMKDGKSLDELLEHVPDEFFNFVKKAQAEIDLAFVNVLLEAQTLFSTTKVQLGDAPRKEYAAVFTKQGRLSGVLFKMLDGADPSDLIWKIVRPESTETFKKDEA